MDHQINKASKPNPAVKRDCAKARSPLLLRYALTGGLMQSNWFRCLAVGFSLVLVGCAGVGVVETSDPYVKLSDASSLFDEQDRPLIAERLIREAIEVCENKSDQLCLAEG